MSITQAVRLEQSKGLAGQEGDLQASNNVSKVNTTEAVIPFGYPVHRDGVDGVKMVSTATTEADIVGVAVRAFNDVTIGEAGINAHRTGTIKTMGTIWVTAGEAVKANDPVHAGVGATVAGKFMKQAGSEGTKAIKMTGWKFLTDAQANETALISIQIGG